ncbi:MAG: hypothetical protein WA687_05815 [Solirubrobacterales bacterium]
MAGRRDTWRETRLWEELLRRGEEPALKVRHLLEDVLPPVEVVLNKGGTTSLNMTLHEAEHSWRVAQWMAEIAGEEVLAEMEPYDLAMLLLSAYLHDIGMTPEAGRVEDFLDFLIDGKPRSLSEGDIEELQAWLDEHWSGLEPPLANDDEPARRAREIVAGYVRHRHNDWSDPWIREYLRHDSERLYPGWVDDLVRLCQSHHFGLRELKGEDFNPKLVDDSAETVLHLRYCACLLRLADILDFDPERTPPILFKHRNVKGESAVHWRKSLGAKIVRRGNQLQLDAQPVDAIAHRAIRQTVTDIERELALCQQLDDETGFQHMEGRGSLPHRWTLDLGIKAKITPRHNAYEYVDGSFRPDVQKLLELLGGVALYGNPLDAIRELLQNAFDAVRERIARERLSQPDPGNAEARDRLASEHGVSLTLESSESGVRLVCRDSGVGMSKEAIVDRFLVGGSTSSPDLLRLERNCEEHGFSVGRTARFGIGVLSYFLLAKRLVLRTRPAAESDAPSDQGWTFTSLGLADFGELKKDPVEEDGTEVVLEIKPGELDGDPKRFAEKVANYVADTVKRVPCQFSYAAPDFGVPGFAFEPGWPNQEKAARGALLSGFVPEEGDPDDDEDPVFDEEIRQRFELIVHQGELPAGLGSYRIFLGHFRLDPGQSIALLDLKPLGQDRYLIEGIGDGDAWVLPSNLSFSWNGMCISPDWDAASWDESPVLQAPDQHAVNAYIEVDWTSDEAGQLAVARNRFTPSVAVGEGMSLIYEKARELWTEFAEDNRDSALALVNAHLLEELPANLETTPSYWAQDLVVDGEMRSVLAPLELPSICIGDDVDTIFRPSFRWRGEAVAPAIGLNIANEDQRKHNHRNWFGDLLGPQYVGAIGADDRLQPVLVWDRFEANDMPFDDRFDYPAKFAQFPPEWRALATVKSSGDRWFLNAWNRENPLCAAVDEVAWDWARETFEESLDPLPHEAEILRSPGRVAAWILKVVYGIEDDFWNDLAERQPEFVDKAWRSIDGLAEEEEILASYIQSGGGAVVRVMTRTRWWLDKDPLAFAHRLGRPEGEWLVDVVGPAPGR